MGNSFFEGSSNLTGRNFRTCCPPTFEGLMSGSEENSTNYSSKYDWFGYGITFINTTSDRAKNIKYKIFVSSNDLKTPEGESDVIWGQYDNNCAWGPHVINPTSIRPIISDIKYEAENENILYFNYQNEGYWQKIDSSGNVENNPDALVALSFAKPQEISIYSNWEKFIIQNQNKSVFSNNGAWRRNWGLYNTMRLIGADNTYTCQLGYSPTFWNKYYLPNEWTAARLIAKLNEDEPVPAKSSSWFIPSMDEMAFICNNLAQINSSLSLQSKEKIIGDYWTSTGAFYYSGGSGAAGDEGVYNVSTRAIKNGSQAWAFNISENEITSENPSSLYSIKTRKENRNFKLKVRAIRIEIDNSNDIPELNAEAYKVWRLEKVKWVDDLGE
jgi:hypothetical protein